MPEPTLEELLAEDAPPSLDDLLAEDAARTTPGTVGDYFDSATAEDAIPMVEVDAPQRRAAVRRGLRRTRQQGDAGAVRLEAPREEVMTQAEVDATYPAGERRRQFGGGSNPITTADVLAMVADASPADVSAALPDWGDAAALVTDTPTQLAPWTREGQTLQGMARGDAPRLPGWVQEDVDPIMMTEGAGQALTIGNLDELSAAVEAPFSDDSYREIQQRNQARGEAIRELYPASHAAGVVGGTLPMFVIPGAREMAQARGAGLVGQSVAAITEGAALGALGGSGMSEHSLGTAEHARDTLRGMGTGAGASAVLYAGGRGLRRLDEWRNAGADRLQHRANQQRLSAMGARSGDLERIDDRYPGGVDRFADDMREMGLTGATDNPDVLAGRAEALRQRSGREISDVLANADGAAPMGGRALVSPHRIQARVIEDVLAPLEGSVTRTDRNAAGVVRDFLDQLEERYPRGLTADDVQRVKAELRTSARFDSRSDPANAVAYRNIYTNVARALDDAITDAGERLGDPGMVDRFQRARREYRVASESADWAQDRMARKDANNVAMPWSEMAGQAEWQRSSGNPLTTAATIVGRNILRDRQHSIAGTTFEGVARILRHNPERLGPHSRMLRAALDNRGQDGLAAAYYILSHRDPDFSRQMEEAVEAEGSTDDAALAEDLGIEGGY